jgi:hypothetical protein
MEVGSAGVGRVRSKPEVSLSRPPPDGMLTVIDIAHVHLGAGAALVQPFFLCASSHSIEPGWGIG